MGDVMARGMAEEARGIVRIAQQLLAGHELPRAVALEWIHRLENVPDCWSALAIVERAVGWDDCEVVEAAGDRVRAAMRAAATGRA